MILITFYLHRNVDYAGMLQFQISSNIYELYEITGATGQEKLIDS